MTTIAHDLQEQPGTPVSPADLIAAVNASGHSPRVRPMQFIATNNIDVHSEE